MPSRSRIRRRLPPNLPHLKKLLTPEALVVTACLLLIAGSLVRQAGAQGSGVLRDLSSPFERKILDSALPEAPFELRFFTTAVKTNSEGRIITGPDDDPVKNLVGAEPAGERAGMERYTKIMFGAAYLDGRPDPGTRIDPNNPEVNSGNQFWPFIPQPFRSWPNALAVTPDGRKLYVTLPGREGYPDWRIAVVDTARRDVLAWVDLRPAGQSRPTRPVGLAVAPLNTAIHPSPYIVVLNQYANFASVIDTATDRVLGEFQTGFYGEDLVFNASGTRLYVTDRFKDQVRAFRVDPGPFFTQIAEIPTAANELDRTNPRDLDLSADGTKLYVGNTLVVRPLPLAEPARRRSVERRRQRGRRRQGLPAEQGHLGQLAGVVRRAQQRHAGLRLGLQRRAGRGGEADRSLPAADRGGALPRREDYVLRKTEENSRAIGRSDLSSKAFVPITFGHSKGGLAGDGKGPLYVSLDRPVVVSPPAAAYPEGRLEVDRLGSDNLAPLVTVVDGRKVINPVLAQNNIRVIRDTHGKTSHLTAADIEALELYLKSLQR